MLLINKYEPNHVLQPIVLGFDIMHSLDVFALYVRAFFVWSRLIVKVECQAESFMYSLRQNLYL